MLANSKDTRDGLLAGLSCYLIWGFLPVYFKWVGEVSPLEVVAHRVIWAIPFGLIFISLRRQWPSVQTALTSRSMMLRLLMSASLIAVNWFVYVWAIQDSRIFETSLGYYINPLTHMLVGVVILGERLRRRQSAAILLAAIGVLILTISGGVLPWVSLLLALTFTFYTYIRKQAEVGAMPGLFIETLVLLPLAFVVLAYLQSSASAEFGAGHARLDLMLMLAGPLTALPLLLFALAAKRLNLTTIGFMQFIAPTLQFGTGVYFGEQLTPPYFVCFACIWTAIGLFSFDAIQNRRAVVRS